MATTTEQKQVEKVATAAAVMVNLETGEHKLVDFVKDDGTGMDPRFRCELLWESVKDDWPGWEVGYVTNEAADALAGDRRLWQCGMKDDNAMTERIEEYNAEVDARRSTQQDKETS